MAVRWLAYWIERTDKILNGDDEVGGCQIPLEVDLADGAAAIRWMPSWKLVGCLPIIVLNCLIESRPGWERLREPGLLGCSLGVSVFWISICQSGSVT
jgi:hypothetical protein